MQKKPYILTKYFFEGWGWGEYFILFWNEKNDFLLMNLQIHNKSTSMICELEIKYLLEENRLQIYSTDLLMLLKRVNVMFSQRNFESIY